MRPVATCLVALLMLAGPFAAQAQTPTPSPEPAHQHGQPTPPPATADDHAAHQPPAPVSLPEFIPPVTDADRQAAFPDVQGHAVHDMAVNHFVLFDQFEWQAGRSDDAFSWDTEGWIGQDRNRFWFRTEGDRAGGRTEQAQTHLLYGRAISRWWDATAGIRLDTLPGTPRTALAVGVQGLAPYWFEVEASAYLDVSGRSHIRVETEYDLLLANRLVLQPLVEFEIYGRSDPERHIGTGLSTADLGVRLRYEFKREFAPYVGVVWNRRFFGTADRAEAAGERTSSTRLTLGVRFWM